MSEPTSRASLGRLAALAIVAAVALAACSPARARTPKHNGAPAAPTKSLTLVGQTSWVAPGHRFHIQLSTSLPLSHLQLSAAIYPRLTSRSALDQVIAGHQQGIPLATLGAAPASRYAAGGSRLALSVAMPSPSGPVSAADIQLPPCTVCDGVYPMVVSLAPPGRSRHPLASLTTEILSISATPNPLHFSWLLPLASQAGFGANGMIRSSTSSLSAAAAEAAALPPGPAGAPTFAPSGEQLLALAQSPSPAAHRALASFRRWAAAPGHDVLATPFSPLDPYAAGRAGLAGLVSQDFRLGASVEGAALATPPFQGAWVDSGPLSSSGTRWLPHYIRSLVLPASAVSASASVLTPDQPFALGSSSRTALVSDASMGSLAARAKSNPVLVAHELLASLAQTYLETPNSPSFRAVVLVVPQGVALPARFLQTFQAGLASSPVVSTSSLPQLFGAIASAGGDLPSRYLDSPYSGPRIDPKALRSDLAQISALSSSFGPSSPALEALRGDLAVASSGIWGTAGTPSSLSGQRAFDRLAKHMKAMVTLSGSKTVTLTSHNGSVPVTILSASPAPITARLELSSPALRFPRGSSKQVLLTHRANSVSFLVSTRGTGDFPLVVRLVSPKGGLVLLEDRLTVRSTAASVVALGLTAAAVGVLALWWVRSSINGRKQRNRHLLPKAARSESAR